MMTVILPHTDTHRKTIRSDRFDEVSVDAETETASGSIVIQVSLEG